MNTKKYTIGDLKKDGAYINMHTREVGSLPEISFQIRWLKKSEVFAMFFNNLTFPISEIAILYNLNSGLYILDKEGEN